MFQSGSDKQLTDDQSYDTVIGPLVKASGVLESSGNVKMAGTFKNGELKIGALLEVASEAKIEANIKAKSVKVHGEIKGNVTAEMVEIGADGKVYGDINAGGNLIIEAGGIFVGKSIMNDKKAKPTSNSSDEEGKKE